MRISPALPLVPGMYQFALFSKNGLISRLLTSELCAVARSAGLNGLLKEILGLAPQALCLRPLRGLKPNNSLVLLSQALSDHG